MLALGLNSGSSLDGIDAVLVDIDLGEDSLLRRPRFIAGKSVDWPRRIAEQVLAAFENKLSIFELGRLNYVAGALYAEAARLLMRETQTPSEALAVIGFDGQTIYQEPADQPRMAAFASDEDLVGRWLDRPYPCGLQIAEPAIVAAACETTVVSPGRAYARRFGRAADAVPGLRGLPRHRAGPHPQHRRNRELPTRGHGPLPNDGFRHGAGQCHARSRRMRSAWQAI